MKRQPRPVRKALFLFPPTRIHREGVKQALPPMGAAYLAAVARERCDVSILDAVAEGFHHERPSTNGFRICGLPVEEIVARVADLQPDLVGITCLYSSNFPVVAEICRAVKAALPSTLTMAGGTHPTFLAEHCLNEVPELDLIALGEGEPVLLDLLEALEQRRGLDTVDGLAFREPRDGRVRLNPKTRFVEDLDALPFPARDLLKMGLYHEIGVPHLIVGKRPRFATVITSRGCPARCNFCSSARFWGHRYRARSADNVLAELQMLAREQDVQEIHFEDDNINLKPERFRRILQGLIDQNLGLDWCAPNGIALWALTPELVRLMKRSGCYEVTLAFESGCQQVLDDIIGKPLKLDRVGPVLAEIKRVGIRTSSFFVVGFPGETLEQIRETFAMPKKLGLGYAWFWIANPLPGTALYETCAQEGLLKEGFEFVNNSFSRCNIETPLWTSSQVERLAHREFMKFNLFNIVRHPLAFWDRYRDLLRRPRLLTDIMRGVALRTRPVAFIRSRLERFERGRRARR